MIFMRIDLEDWYRIPADEVTKQFAEDGIVNTTSSPRRPGTSF